jgi:hypothetical protein
MRKLWGDDQAEVMRPHVEGGDGSRDQQEAWPPASCDPGALLPLIRRRLELDLDSESSCDTLPLPSRRPAPAACFHARWTKWDPGVVPKGAGLRTTSI